MGQWPHGRISGAADRAFILALRIGLVFFAYASSDGVVLNPFWVLFLQHFGDDFRGVKVIKERNPRRGLKGTDPGSIPCRSEVLLTVPVDPPRLQGQPTFPYTIGSAHAARGQVSQSRHLADGN